MPNYVSRDAQPMTEEEWRAAFAREGVRRVLRNRDCTGKRIVETSWVGWCFSGENPPLPFLVSLSEPGGPSVDTWHATEREALARHIKLAGG
jgi:hypothetical protein